MGNRGQGPGALLPGKEKLSPIEAGGAERTIADSSTKVEAEIGVGIRVAGETAAGAIGKAKEGECCGANGERTAGLPRNGGTVGADERADKSAAEEPNKEETPRG